MLHSLISYHKTLNETASRQTSRKFRRRIPLSSFFSLINCSLDSRPFSSRSIISSEATQGPEIETRSWLTSHKIHYLKSLTGCLLVKVQNKVFSVGAKQNTIRNARSEFHLKLFKGSCKCNSQSFSRLEQNVVVGPQNLMQLWAKSRRQRWRRQD